MVTIGSPVFASRFDKKSFNVLAHIGAPVLSILVLLIPLISFVMPTIPGAIGNYFTGLGFAATLFPLNILPLFVLAWIIVGLAYSFYLSSSSPERYEGMGRIIRGDVYAAESHTCSVQRPAEYPVYPLLALFGISTPLSLPSHAAQHLPTAKHL